MTLFAKSLDNRLPEKGTTDDMHAKNFYSTLFPCFLPDGHYVAHAELLRHEILSEAQSLDSHHIF